jgi:hypothetical protein
VSEYSLHEFNNIGFLQSKFTEEELSPIKQEIVEIQKNFFLAESVNYSLAGHIRKEYKLSKSKQYIENLLLPYVIEFDNQSKYLQSLNLLNKDVSIKLEYPWVNFMKKHEFNPPHNHSGLLSFVIWIKIPFNIEEEFQQFPDIKHNATGCFNFLYINSLGKICTHTIKADKNMENCILIFPSELTHFVNPFYTSDDYRISISGNFKFHI